MLTFGYMSITLRKWNSSDLELLVHYANNAQLARNMTDAFPFPYDEEAGRKFIAMTQQEDPRKILAIEADGLLVGSIGIFPQSDIFKLNAELGYWLAEPFWGKGIMSESIPLMIDYAYKNWAIDRIFARPFGRNIASQRVLEKAGFIFEHRIEKNLIKNNQLEDEFIYSIRRESYYARKKSN